MKRFFSLVAGLSLMSGSIFAAPLHDAGASSDGAGVPFPGPTLASDLIGLNVVVGPDYPSGHPRLLFGGTDREALRRKAEQNPKLWGAVLAHANWVKTAASTPTSAAISRGDGYWKVEFVEASALAWVVTGDAAYRDGALRWMKAYCGEALWGTLFRPNLDLAASWYLYHLAIAYDILYVDLDEGDRRFLRDSLAAHARAIYDDFDPAKTEKIRYDQNHTYIPTTALVSASLALLGEVPEAQDWLNRSYAVLRRSRYVQGEDGYYYEGYGYWSYALHWQVRAAELLSRATGEKLFDIPFLKDDWLYALYMSLPEAPGAFSIHDSGLWDAGQTRPATQSSNLSMLWAIAAATGSRESQTLGNYYEALQPEASYPTSAFLWYDPSIMPVEWKTFPPYHEFDDHGVVTWRSGWGRDATSYLFRCGPPEGHKAMEKLSRLSDWQMNAGHVHPNIGGFWIHANGAYLAVETGYTAKKWTRDHNTLLIDGKGQGADGTYHNDLKIPYADFDGARLDQVFLCDAYGYASGEFGSAYKAQVPGVLLRRTVLMATKWMIVLDEMKSAEEHRPTWFCHVDAEPKQEGAAYVTRLPQAGLAIVPLFPAELEGKIAPTVVQSGLTIGEVSPEKGRPLQHGWHVELSPKQAASSVTLATLLAILDKDAAPPTAIVEAMDKDRLVLRLMWPDGKKERIELNRAWKKGAGGGPALLSVE